MFFLYIYIYFRSLRIQSLFIASLNLFREVSAETLGSFSNDDGDGNQDVKKAIGLLRKTTTLHVYHAFFVHFFTVLARLRRKNA